jgi:hypothetical protein
MKSAYKITGYYALFSTLWIILSDVLLVSVFGEKAFLKFISSAKGIAFVAVTSLLLFIMIKRELGVKNKIIVQLDREVEIREELIRELHHRIKNNLQVVIGLMNIETMDRDFSKEVKDRITNKLISMMSVFNIVYEMRDMRGISFFSVLQEYQRISVRNINIARVKSDIGYSVEVIISCLLLIDSIIDVYLGNNNSVATWVSSESRGLVDLEFKTEEQRLNEPSDKDRAFIELQAKSIDGSVETDIERSLVRIRFSRFE